MSTINVLNTDSGLTGTTLINAENAQNITGLKSFNRSPSAPFAVNLSSAVVTNLDADKVDGYHLDQDVRQAQSPSWVGVTLSGNFSVGGTSTLTGKVTAPNSIISLRGVDLTLPSAAPTINGQALTGTTGGVLSWGTPSTAWTLLKQGSGTSAATVATNVDTIAISGLTAADHLVIFVEQENTTAAQAASTQIYSTTDSYVWAQPGALSGTADFGIMHITIGPTAGSNTRLAGTMSMFDQTADTDGSAANATFRQLLRTPTTAWTGSFTLALRLQNSATGSTKWKWAVYKVLGQ
jgi:hypothetical protein